jgi:hypothetical protein
MQLKCRRAGWRQLTERVFRNEAIATYLALAFVCLNPLSVIAKPISFHPLFQDVTLSPNFSPNPSSVKGIGGGSTPIQDISEIENTPTGACAGFVEREPDRHLVLGSFFDYLKIEVQSAEDTTILIKGPGGTWCNDDYQGKNPGVAGQWLPGSYQIWIGSHKEEEYYPYVIRFTEEPQTSP